MALYSSEGSTEVRYLVRAIFAQKAAALDVDPIARPESCGGALLCAWTTDERAAQLSASWADALRVHPATDLYGVRQQVLSDARELDDESLGWQLHTALDALARPPAYPGGPISTRARGLQFLKTLTLKDFQAQVSDATRGARLVVQTPRTLPDSSRGVDVEPATSSEPVPPDEKTAAPEPQSVTIDISPAPAHAIAMVGWPSVPDPSTSDPRGIRLGLEVIRRRFNQTHEELTGVTAAWSERSLGVEPDRLILSGSDAGIPSALDLLFDEFSRLVSASGLPTAREVERALVHLQETQRHDLGAPRAASEDCQASTLARWDPATVAEAVRSQGLPRAVVVQAGEAKTETSE